MARKHRKRRNRIVQLSFTEEEVMALNFTLSEVVTGLTPGLFPPPEYEEHLRTGMLKLSKAI